jgi:hypothetical protein
MGMFWWWTEGGWDDEGPKPSFGTFVKTFDVGVLRASLVDALRMTSVPRVGTEKVVRWYWKDWRSKLRHYKDSEG